MLAAAALAVAGNTLLVHALRSADLSILGPVNAYKSVIGLVLAIFLIGEYPSPLGVAGVLLIIAGSYMVVDRQVDQPGRNAFVLFFRERGVQLRFAALVLSATEAVFLKRAILLSSAVDRLCPVVAARRAAGRRHVPARWHAAQEQKRILRRGWRTFLALAFTTGLMQLTTVLTFHRMQVGYSLALFQLSTIVSVLLGYHYFQEQNIRKRLAGSMVMTAGAIDRRVSILIVTERSASNRVQSVARWNRHLCCFEAHGRIASANYWRFHQFKLGIALVMFSAESAARQHRRLTVGRGGESGTSESVRFCDSARYDRYGCHQVRKSASCAKDALYGR